MIYSDLILDPHSHRIRFHRFASSSAFYVDVEPGETPRAHAWVFAGGCWTTRQATDAERTHALEAARAYGVDLGVIYFGQQTFLPVVMG